MRDNRETARRLLQKDLKKAIRARDRASASPSIVAEQNVEPSRDAYCKTDRRQPGERAS